MAESVNDVATVQQNLPKNLDDANARSCSGRLNRGLQQELMGICCPRESGRAALSHRSPDLKELGKRVTWISRRPGGNRPFGPLDRCSLRSTCFANAVTTASKSVPSA